MYQEHSTLDIYLSWDQGNEIGMILHIWMPDNPSVGELGGDLF
jgi:hypothetical protein